MRWAHPNRQRHYKVQHKGHKGERKRCRRYTRWKKKYGSKEAAQEAAFSMAERFSDYDYHAFECNCGWWHVGRKWERPESESA